MCNLLAFIGVGGGGEAGEGWRSFSRGAGVNFFGGHHQLDRKAG